MLEPIDRETESKLFSEIDIQEIATHLDAFEGLQRESGSADEWEASEYIVETLRSYGVDATIEEYEGYISRPQSATVHVTSPRSKTFENATTTAFSASTPQGGVSGDLMHLESVQSDSGFDDLSDCILYVPNLPKPRYTAAADQANAEGILFRSPDDHLHQGIVSPLWGTPSTENVDHLPAIPVAEVNRTDGMWIEESLEHGGVNVTLQTSVQTEVTTLPNPVGRLDGAKSDRYMIVGNHVDSWFEGITDNATAMAATLEVARIFANRETKRGLIFGFWSAHSTGRYAGSTAFVDRHFPDLRENGVVYLHLDLNGLKGADSLWYQHMAELEAEHIDAMETATSLSIREPEESYLGSTGRPARNSDQSFWGAGLSSLLSGARFAPGTEDGGPVGGGWWWHTPEDTRDKVDLEVLTEEIRLYLAIVSRICGSPVLPHDFRETVTDARSILSSIEGDADGAVVFEAEREDLADLEQRLEEFYDHVNRLDSTERLDEGIEDLQVRLANTLNPALYMEGPDTQNEPSAGWDRMPYLRTAANLTDGTGQEQLFTKTSLQRGRIRLRHRVQRATRLVEEYLEE